MNKENLIFWQKPYKIFINLIFYLFIISGNFSNIFHFYFSIFDHSQRLPLPQNPHRFLFHERKLIQSFLTTTPSITDPFWFKFTTTEEVLYAINNQTKTRRVISFINKLSSYFLLLGSRNNKANIFYIKKTTPSLMEILIRISKFF